MDENLIKERFCPECNTQVIQNANECPSCKTFLYKRNAKLFANIIGYFWGFFWALIIGVPFGLIMNAIKPDSKFIYTLSMVVAGAIFFITQGAKREKLIAKGDLAVWKNVESSKANSDQPTD